MNQLYTKGSVIFKLWEHFSPYFLEQTEPTKKHLFELMLSVLALDGFQSVRCNYEHFIKDISQSKLKSYYFTLNESKIDISKWMEHMIHAALSVIPKDLEKQPVILFIDDTMIYKHGEKFELLKNV